MSFKWIAILAALATLALSPTAMASRALDVDPNQVRFGKQPFNSFTTKSFTVTNRSAQTLDVSLEATFVPDDFSPGQPGSTCATFEPKVLGPGESCVHAIGYYADPAIPFLGHRSIRISVVARDQSGATVDRQVVKVSARGV